MGLDVFEGNLHIEHMCSFLCLKTLENLSVFIPFPQFDLQFCRQQLPNNSGYDQSLNCPDSGFLSRGFSQDFWSI